MAKLGEVCIQITDGSHNPPSGVEQSEYLMLSSKNIDDDFITLDSPRFLSHSDYIAENKRTTVSEGDLLMTIVGTIGRVAIVPKELKGICLQRSVAVIKPEREVVNNRYLMYQLQNMRPFLEKEARGVAQKGIYLKQVSQLDIKLPELEHQMQIVKVLDKASKLIFLRRQQLAKLDELVKARFVEMFGEPAANPNRYKKKKLSEIAVYFNGLTYKPENVSDEGMIVLRSSNIQNGKLDFEDVVRVDCAVKEKFVVKENDILMCSRNGSSRLVGKVALIKNVWEPMSFGAFMMIIRSDYYWYLMTYFQMASFREQIKAGTTTTINQITGRMLDSIMIPLPPVDVQNQFATFAERVDQQKQTVQQSLEKLELMKKALMQEYFG